MHDEDNTGSGNGGGGGGGGTNSFTVAVGERKCDYAPKRHRLVNNQLNRAGCGSGSGSVSDVGVDGGTDFSCCSDGRLCSCSSTCSCSSVERIGITLLLWGTSMVLALSFDNLGVVLSLTGAVAASTLGYILPPLIYFKTYEWEFAVAWSNAFGYEGLAQSEEALATASLGATGFDTVADDAAAGGDRMDQQRADDQKQGQRQGVGDDDDDDDDGRGSSLSGEGENAYDADADVDIGSFSVTGGDHADRARGGGVEYSVNPMMRVSDTGLEMSTIEVNGPGSSSRRGPRLDQPSPISAVVSAVGGATRRRGFSRLGLDISMSGMDTIIDNSTDLTEESETVRGGAGKRGGAESSGNSICGAWNNFGLSGCVALPKSLGRLYALRDFFLPAFMIAFGAMALVVGVSTVIFDNA